MLLALLLALAGGEEPPLQEPPAEGSAEAEYRDEIDVLAVTPLAGAGVPRDRVPVHAQSATASDLESLRRLDLTSMLDSNLASVHRNDVQNNLLQPDLQFRGFGASPLLGSPQGLAVYQDGVRINEVFGDTVNWDLVPEPALLEIDLLPGSTPLFGANALGGALSLRTRSGFDGRWRRLRFDGGSFERRMAQAAIGEARGRAAYFLAGRYFEEEGWRDFSPSRSAQLFAKGEWSLQEHALLGIASTFARSELTGNGAAPVELLELRRAEIFTHPDETANRLLFPILRGQLNAGSTLVLEGQAFLRATDVDTFNGDERGEAGEEEGEVREHRAIDDEDLFDAVNNTSLTDQEGAGVALQLTLLEPLRGRDHQLAVGLSAERGEARFASQSELAMLTPDRGTKGSGLFDPHSFVRVDAEMERFALFARGTLAVTPRLALSVAGRYDHSAIRLSDRLGTELNGDHRFRRFNPSLGLTFGLRERPTSSLVLFLHGGRSSRTPTPVELTCADPDAPCRLPNAFVADPPLDEVVTSSFELGLRGHAERLRWGVAAFLAESRDDIVFIASGRTRSEGFFSNVEATRRRGLEGLLRGSWANGSWFVSYTLVDAEFATALTVPSPLHPLAERQLDVIPGDRLPGVPRHQGRTGVDVGLGARWRLAAALRASSGRFLRGDEANLLDPVSGFAVLDLQLGYRVNASVDLFAVVDNVFDRDFETFGLLGDASEVLGEGFADPRFLSPGEPFAVRLGVELGL